MLPGAPLVLPPGSDFFSSQVVIPAGGPRRAAPHPHKAIKSSNSATIFIDLPTMLVYNKAIT